MSSILVGFKFFVFRFGCPPFRSSSILVFFNFGILPLFLHKSSSWIELRLVWLVGVGGLVVWLDGVDYRPIYSRD